MNIVYLHEGGPEFASYRYRVAIPSQHIVGHKVTINEGEPDILVLSKPTIQTVAAGQAAKESGVKIVVDVCDDHLESQLYQQAIALADRVVAPTVTLRDKIGQGEVIPDPYEYTIRPAHANGDKYIWFGRAGNIGPLRRWFPFLHRFASTMTIVCDKNNLFPHVPWSYEALEEEAMKANVALFPTDGGQEHKSANRLINALALGLFPVSGHSPAYDEFKPFCWSGVFHVGMQWAKAFPHLLDECVTAGQEYIQRHYSPEVVGKQWQMLFDSI